MTATLSPPAACPELVEGPFPSATAARPPLGSHLLYAQCWEDVACARAALRIQPGDTVLAIGAAGDNVLALLRDAPTHILAIDINPAQSALLELKLAATRRLPPHLTAPFLGATILDPTAHNKPSPRDTNHEQRLRLAAYDDLRPTLSNDAQRYWDHATPQLGAGVIHTGRFERYLALFRRWVLRLVPGSATVRAMLRASSLAEQRALYARRWDTPAWRALFRLFFSRRLLAAFGRHPALFTHCTMRNVGDHYLTRARIALTDLPLLTNPYATYMLSGAHSACLPDYLQPQALDAAARLADRVEVRTASLLDTLVSLPDRSIDAFYLSDVFEMFSQDDYEAALEETIRVGRPDARLCYWNNLVDRRRPPRLAPHLHSDDSLASTLFAQDRAFLYSRFVVETLHGAAS